MTTYMNITEKCAICGKESTHAMLTSTNTFEAPDLDLRPSEMMRSTMSAWIWECPHCGYVSKRLEDKTSVNQSFLEKQEYIHCSGHHFSSKLAALFYKHYLICKADQNQKAAFSAILHAAWSCDDKNDHDHAVLCRKLAIEEMNVLIKQEPDNTNLKIQKVDLLRRAEMFHEAIECCNSWHVEDELLNQILAFQMDRCKANDTKCYTIHDITEE